MCFRPTTTMTPIKCPECGAFNKPTNDECMKCGADLSAAKAEAAANSGAAAPAAAPNITLEAKGVTNAPSAPGAPKAPGA